MPDYPEYQTPVILHDNPLVDDETAEFHFDRFAGTLARLIASKGTKTPLTIGISGTWGTGKTTLLRRLQRQLKQTRRLLDDTKPAVLEFANPNDSPHKDFRACRTVWFNAWKYANEDALLVALVRVIVQEMFRDDLISKLGAAFWEPFTPRRDVIETVLGWFSIKTPFGDAGLDTGKKQSTPLEQKMALLDQFDEAFDRLMAAWVHRTPDVHKIQPEKGVLVVFIDDLDRCLPQKAIQVLEAIKLFFDKEGCIFVLGADMDFIQQAVISHYKEMGSPAEAVQKASDYIEKVVQIRFRLPQIGKDDMQRYLGAQPVHDSLRQRWQALVAAAEANPRRVKAVVNDLELQWGMLANSGQSQGVNRDDFICWQALMRAAPPAFHDEFYGIPEDEGGLRLRHQFILGALRWVCGSEQEKAALNAGYEKYTGREARRLRDVLREIGSFSDEFTPAALNAHVHLAAPPQRKPAAAVTRESPAVKSGPSEEAEAQPTKGLVGRGAEMGGEWIERTGMLFCPIPAGDFVMGSTDDNPLAFDEERPRHTVTIDQEYWLGRFPVTNAQFRRFVQANPDFRTTAEQQGSAYAWTGKGWQESKGADWQHPRSPESSLEGKDEHPVVCVSWHDALAYCHWLNRAYGKELPQGWSFRLPTEAEWEKASRDPRGSREWPWGNEAPDASYCNFDMNMDDTTPVGVYSPKGDSPYGCADMAGNVWEWTQSGFEKYPYNADDRREGTKANLRVLRGGGFGFGRSVRCAYRYWGDPDYRSEDTGFRVAFSPISGL